MAMTYEEAKQKAEDQKYSATGSTEGVDENYIQSLMNDTTYAGDTAANQQNENSGDTGGGGGGGGSKRSSSGKSSSTSLIDSIYSNSLTAQERQLKAALDDILDQLDAQKETTYANQMVANKNSNEAMLNQGINSGAIAQAALSSNNALQGNLGAINQSEIDARNNYANDLASLQAQIESEKMNALLQDYYNQRTYDYQTSRDAVSDQQYADSLALQKEQYANSLTQSQQEQAINLLNMGLSTAQAASLLGVSQDDINGYVAYVNALQNQNLASSTTTSSGSGSVSSSVSKPNLTLNQAETLLKEGVSSPEILAAYKYYTGVDYSGGGSGFSDNGSGNISTPTNNTALEQSIEGYIRMGDKKSALVAIKQWLDKGWITEAEKNSLIERYSLAS